MKYDIFFMHPGSREESADFSSATPFAPVHAGDLILGVTWKGSACPAPPELALRPYAKVTHVVRSLNRIAGTLYDSTYVYTTELEIADL